MNSIPETDLVVEGEGMPALKAAVSACQPRKQIFSLEYEPATEFSAAPAENVKKKVARAFSTMYLAASEELYY